MPWAFSSPKALDGLCDPLCALNPQIALVLFTSKIQLSLALCCFFSSHPQLTRNALFSCVSWYSKIKEILVTVQLPANHTGWLPMKHLITGTAFTKFSNSLSDKGSQKFCNSLVHEGHYGVMVQWIFKRVSCFLK